MVSSHSHKAESPVNPCFHVWEEAREEAQGKQFPKKVRDTKFPHNFSTHIL